MAFNSAEIVVREIEAGACHAETVLAALAWAGSSHFKLSVSMSPLSRLHHNRYAIEHTKDLILPLNDRFTK